MEMLLLRVYMKIFCMKKSIMVLACLFVSAAGVLSAQSKTEKLPPPPPVEPPPAVSKQVAPPPPPAAPKKQKDPQQDAFFKKHPQVKNIHWKDGKIVTITRKDGTSDRYDTSVDTEAEALKEKYGELPVAPPPPPPPAPPAVQSDDVI